MNNHANPIDHSAHFFSPLLLKSGTYMHKIEAFSIAKSKPTDAEVCALSLAKGNHPFYAFGHYFSQAHSHFREGGFKVG